MRTKLKHWWQRNFGYVYLTDESVLGDGKQYRFRARRGKIAMAWHIINGETIGFTCRLAPNWEVQNIHDRSMSGYGKQYGGWIWSYEPFWKESDVAAGGFWK